MVSQQRTPHPRLGVLNTSRRHFSPCVCPADAHESQDGTWGGIAPPIARWFELLQLQIPSGPLSDPCTSRHTSHIKLSWHTLAWMASGH